MKILFYGLRRSGNHAILEWLIQNMGGPSNRTILKNRRIIACGNAAYINECNTYRDELDLKNDFVKLESMFKNHIISFEDTHLDDSSLSDAVGNLSGYKKVVVVRNIKNLFASRFKYAQKKPSASKNMIIDKSKVALWKEHATTKDAFIISFEDWVVSKEYRDNVCEALGILNHDVTHTITEFGGGSSFSGQVKPTEKELLNRSKSVNLPETVVDLIESKDIQEINQGLGNLDTSIEYLNNIVDSDGDDLINYSGLDFKLPGISVIMPSYLEDYKNSRSNPVEKFNRAVQSFLNQTHSDKELIIVSDGCELTNKEYETNWSSFNNIKLIKISKSLSKWPGTNRQIGIDNASKDLITYLDTDDILHQSHLTNIAHHNKPDIDVLFNISHGRGISFNITGNLNSWLFVNGIKMHRKRLNEYIKKQKEGSKLIELDGKIYSYIPDTLQANVFKFSTSMITHKRSCDVKWTDRNARGEDTIFADALKAKYDYKLINSPTYIVCHIPGRLDI